MNSQNSCNKFKFNGSTCPDVWSSIESSELLMYVLEMKRQCKRQNADSCTGSAVEQLKGEERQFWECLDKYCAKNGDQLVKSRKAFLDKMSTAFENFKRGL